MYSKIIEMDIWSSFGCFSKPFSSSGGILTYLIPPKTSIIGMIGAVLGYKFDDYVVLENKSKKFKIEELFDIKISIQPLFDLKTKRVVFNYNAGNRENNLYNIKQDILIQPFYKLFISFPDTLKHEERIFLDRIKANETIFNLYMGRNEFFLNYKFNNYFSYENFILNEKNSDEFFSSNNKIYGTLKRSLIKNTELKESKIVSNNILFENKKSTFKLQPFYEYIINDFPIMRKNFVDFDFDRVSFYSTLTFEDCFFSKVILKENCFLELCKIGDNQWICLF